MPVLVEIRAKPALSRTALHEVFLLASGRCRHTGNIARKRPSFAFSLVEVAIALGIFCFGIVSVLGLLPIGLKVSRDSIGEVVESNILQQIASDAELTDFDKLKDSVFYFDDEGVLLSSSASSNCLYTVKTKVFTSTIIPGVATPEPGAPGVSWDAMALLRIDCTPISGRGFTQFIHIAKLNQ